MSKHIDTIDLGEDITLKVWINDKTGLVNSSLIRLEQDDDSIIISGLQTIDHLIAMLTTVREESLKTVELSRRAD